MNTKIISSHRHRVSQSIFEYVKIKIVEAGSEEPPERRVAIISLEVPGFLPTEIFRKVLIPEGSLGLPEENLSIEEIRKRFGNGT